MAAPISSGGTFIREIGLALPGLATGLARVVRLSYRERLGRPFALEIDFVAPDGMVEPAKILGRPVAATLQMPDGGRRHLHGIASELRRIHRPGEDDPFACRVSVESWLGMLRLRRWSRWFQDKNALEILAAVFQATGQTAYEVMAIDAPPTREFRAQHDETDLDFVLRTAEHDGLYSFWRHAADRHTLVLCDSFANHGPFPGAETLVYDPDESAEGVREVVTSWDFRHRLVSESVTSDDYNYRLASTSLAATEQVLGASTLDGAAEYRFPAGVFTHDEARRDARLRSEAIACEALVYEGTSNSLKIAAGYQIRLQGFPVSGDNGEFLVTTAHLEIDAASAGDDAAFAHRCTFEAIPCARQFRPRRLTPKPLAAGVHSAFVHAPEGQPPTQPYADGMARLQVTIPWNRGGDPSCWIRVSQLLAGHRWGALHLARAGNEVLIGFEHHDIDRPVILGCVYNGDHLPPVLLPDAAGVSIIKDPSGNFIALNPIPSEPTITLSSPWKSTSIMIGGTHPNDSSIGGAGPPDVAVQAH